MKTYTARYRIEIEVDVAAKSRGEVETTLKKLDMEKLVGEYVPNTLEILTIKERVL